MEKLDLAKKVYAEIVRKIIELEEKHHVIFSLPAYLDVDGERFYKNKLLDQDLHDDPVN